MLQSVVGKTDLSEVSVMCSLGAMSGLCTSYSVVGQTEERVCRRLTLVR